MSVPGLVGRRESVGASCPGSKFWFDDELSGSGVTNLKIMFLTLRAPAIETGLNVYAKTVTVLHRSLYNR